MIIKCLALAILTEALVELIFTAAPLQGLRTWFIKKTPWLNSTDRGHLLECKYCTSIWIAAGVILLATFADFGVTRLAAFSLIIARISNLLHLFCSTIRDMQINLRLTRR
ncbi:MAG: DUF1360 domain-containing protein [Alphaproteobacteria bacterium]|nr:DUF1360 domain-containing protein [Alphaproteobacteria bacterium]